MDRLWAAPELLEVLGDWADRPGPMYQRLSAAVRDAVAQGNLVAGDRLPSERDLAKALAVSRATVVSAYDDLRAESIVDSRQGSGTRVRRGVAPERTGRVHGGTATAIVQRLIDTPGEMISLGNVTAPGLDLLTEELHGLVREDLAQVLGESGYHPRGLPRLREAIAARYAAAGLATTADQLVVTTGASQAIALVTQLLLTRGSTVVVESPSWPGCLDALRAAGVRLVGVPLDDEGIRPDLLARALPEHRPDLVYVMPNAHNPTGVTMSAPRRRQVADLAARHGVPVLEDSPDPGLDPLPVAAFSPGVTLTLGSLTKPVWAGLRIGWVRAPADVAARLARLKALADLGSPVLDQALAARLLPRLDALTAEREAALRERRDFLEAALAESLPAWRWRSPAAGSSLWIELPGADSVAFAQVALRHGVEVVAGAATDPTGAHDSYVRVGFNYPPRTLAAMVDRLRQAWEATGRR
ncbi:aminotransferase-like domain-containing protein [Phytohabitans houttuyneae]|uniref:aminotransferase-like domain-containing protein n=1 Tax=Phytohabitans houttuyneae TaxID=1076126 RepID=UPI001C49BBE4|nr:PLP-dependent aminotransferase family protein [Phytohabitans houttuyneae]